MAKKNSKPVEVPPVSNPDAERPSTRKTTCPIRREQFRQHAKSMEVAIGGQTFKVPVKEFSTGSLGWYLTNKMNVEIDGKDCAVQIGLNLTIIGSKDLPS